MLAAERRVTMSTFFTYEERLTLQKYLKESHSFKEIALIRRVLPKGSSFNHLAQEDITLMMNHINSYKRKKLNNRSPYETFSFCHGEEVLKNLDVRRYQPMKSF
jgi:hypothetical protein